MRRIVSIWFPNFPIERFIRGRRKTTGLAPQGDFSFGLVETGATGLRLVAVNTMARKLGLHPGQRLADARAQVPDFLSELHEPEQDRASLMDLCGWMERYSPWAAPDLPDGLLLDVTGVSHLFGGEPAMLAGIGKHLLDHGFTARFGIAPTIGAAWALARYGGTDLQNLPVAALRIDGESDLTLRRLGLKTIGSLLSLPRAALARRFRGETIPENALLRLDEATGLRAEPLNPLNPPSSFIAHHALMEPVVTGEGLDVVLASLVANLIHQLEKRSRGATRLFLKLFRTDGTHIGLPAGFSSPSQDTRHLLRILRPKLETIDASFGIDAMTLEARETAPAIVQQYGFMEDGDFSGLEQLNDRMMNRHGAEILALQEIESHVPERAEAPRSPLPGETRNPPVRAKTRKTSCPPQPIPAFAGMVQENQHPFLIFDRREPATVIASVPEGPPMRFTWRRVLRCVVNSQGPERIAPEWWRLQEKPASRDYYLIEDDRGRRYWLYREGLYGEAETPPKWFVHGLSP